MVYGTSLRLTVIVQWDILTTVGDLSKHQTNSRSLQAKQYPMVRNGCSKWRDFNDFDTICLTLYISQIISHDAHNILTDFNR